MDLRRTRRENIGGIDFRIHGIGLTCVDHEKDFVVSSRRQSRPGAHTNHDPHSPFLLPHLFESICKVKCTDFFVVLEFKELVASMAGHVHENIRSLVRQQTFRPRNRWFNPTCRSTNTT